MFNILYNRYIEQIKVQQIQNYNLKHQDYLIRSGKLYKDSPLTKITHEPKTSKTSQRPIKTEKSKNIQNLNANPIRRHNQPLSNIYEKENQPSSNVRSQFIPIKKNLNSHQSVINQSQCQGQNYDSSSRPTHSLQIHSNHQNNDSIISNNKNQRFIEKSKQNKSFSAVLNQFPQQQEEIVLQQCPEGCGRKFKFSVLEKHVKICQKVFQGKRKAFKVDVVDDQAKKLAAKSSFVNEGTKKNDSEKIPKWKKQSQMLRKGLQAQHQSGNNQSLVVQDQEDDRVKCGGCGRKFNQQAAQKHIPSCIKRAKQKK